MEYIEDPYIVDTREVPKLESVSVVPETIYISIASYDDPYLIRTIKSIIDNKNGLIGKMIIFDTLKLDFRKVKLTKNCNYTTCPRR